MKFDGAWAICAGFLVVVVVVVFPFLFACAFDVMSEKWLPKKRW